MAGSGETVSGYDVFLSYGTPDRPWVRGLRVGCPVCAHFVHYTSRRNRVPPRRGFRVEVQ